MIAYASRTGTKRNLDALRAHGWRLLVSAAGVWRTEGFSYALDNGAWSSFQQGIPFDEGRFAGLLTKLGSAADWCVVPDIVAGGLASLELSMCWLPRVLDACPVALVAVQDGMGASDVAPLLGPRVGIFVGGSTEWKLATMRDWGALGRKAGCWTHVGRVNSRRRIALCAEAGAQSFDGTSVTRFGDTIYRLDAEMRQGVLKLW